MPKLISDELSDATSCNNCSLGKTAIYHGIINKNPGLVRSCRSHVVQYGPGRVVMRQDQTDLPGSFCTKRFDRN